MQREQWRRDGCRRTRRRRRRRQGKADLSVVLAVALVVLLPNKVVVHWGAASPVDGSSSSSQCAFPLFLFPVFCRCFCSSSSLFSSFFFCLFFFSHFSPPYLSLFFFILSFPSLFFFFLFFTSKTLKSSIVNFDFKNQFNCIPAKFNRRP